MKLFGILCFLALGIASALAQTEDFFKPCSKSNVTCLSESAADFLSQTSAGRAEFDIKPIEPLEIQKLLVELPDNAKVHLKNIIVRGLKNLKINNFNIDCEAKSVVLGMESDVNIEAEIDFEYKGTNSSGTLSARAVHLPTAKYNYDLILLKGKQYFTLGSETITYDVKGDTQMKLSNDVIEAILKDTIFVEDAKKKILGSIITKATETVIHNLRMSAKLLPVTAYFTDM